MNGIINVYKPRGISSHDVIYKVRKALDTRKVGHTGTLDPLAEGVLPICVGKATKAVEFIMASEKEYFCTLDFGAETNTQDITGEITKTSQKRVARTEFEEVLCSFLGETEQIPPMYSALHYDGKRLYQLAREGKEIERDPRRINISGIELLRYDKDSADILVKCSKGTYIRTLCEDIGKKTGTLAYMSALKRTRSGAFGIENSVPLEEISEDKLIPIDVMFSEYDRIDLDHDDERRVKNGLSVRYGADLGKKFRLYGADGSFLCISESIQDGDLRILKMIKGFY